MFEPVLGALLMSIGQFVLLDLGFSGFLVWIVFEKVVLIRVFGWTFRVVFIANFGCAGAGKSGLESV
ncbi:hypothetical protein [Arcanobacterium canis]